MTTAVFVFEVNYRRSVRAAAGFFCILKYPIDSLIVDDISIVDSLADSSVIEGIIPAKKRLDALHAVFYIKLITWNYKQPRQCEQGKADSFS